ncbi:hypothetical protein [Streptomyces mirabilis]|uniref:hypothetical protein n=1 Tax=Streptomyces mirabilis TaxID=68239 RepID=UPI003325B7C0
MLTPTCRLQEQATRVLTLAILRTPFNAVDKHRAIDAERKAEQAERERQEQERQEAETTQASQKAGGRLGRRRRS